MENECKEMINTAPHYPQVMTNRNEEEKPFVRCDPERITRQLLSVWAAGDDSNESDRQPGNSHLGLGYGDAQQRGEVESYGVVCELNFANLSEGDQVLIETTHSVYNFKVIDPTIPSGRLIGGVLGNRLVQAALISPGIKNESSRFARKSINVGSGLIFIIEWGDDLRRLTTSTVTSLVHKKKDRKLCAPVCVREKVRLEHVSRDKSDR